MEDEEAHPNRKDTMMEIRPEYMTLSKLLDNRLFEIPDYQRAYSWESRQRAELFDDIRRISERKDNESHFMSTIVCRRKDTILLGTNMYDKLDIVDGQQRLTTLILLLNAIKLNMDAHDFEENEIQNLSRLLVKPEGDNLLLLQTNHDASRYFSNFLRRGAQADPEHADTLADREILRGINESNKFIEEWGECGQIFA